MAKIKFKKYIKYEDNVVISVFYVPGDLDPLMDADHIAVPVGSDLVVGDEIKIVDLKPVKVTKIVDKKKKGWW